MKALRNIYKRYRKKVRQEKGETLVEVLASLLIMTPCMLMLAGAIVSSSKVNASLKNSDNTQKNMPQLSSATEITGGKVVITGDVSGEVGIKLYKDENGYYYFDTK